MLFQTVLLIDELMVIQRGNPIEVKHDDGFRLVLVKAEGFHDVLLGIRLPVGFLDDRNDFINDVDRSY